MIRTIQAGKVVEKSKFWVPEGVKPRAWKHKKMTNRKRDINARQAVKILARELNCNLREGDILLTLNYADEKDMGKKQAANFLRRLKRAVGNDLKWWIVHSETNGKTGDGARFHHHLVLSGGGFSFRDGAWYAGEKPLCKLWGLGDCHVRTISGQDDYTPIAVYLLRQAKAEEFEKKWSCSKNLEKPVIRESVVVQSGPIRVPKGAKLLHEGEYDRYIGSHYIRYVPGRKETHGGHKERKLWEDADGL